MNSEILLLLSNFEGISENNYKYIISDNMSCDHFWKKLENCDDSVYKYIKSEYHQVAKERLSENNLKKILKDMSNHGIKYLQKSGNLLYYIGDINLLDSRKVTFFGSRNCSSNAIEVTQHICKTLNEHDIVSVCGLSYGIDEAVLRSSERNIGVCCGGILSQTFDINKYSLCISFKGLYVPPLKYLYNLRNDFMIGISDCSVIIEAHEAGNTLKSISKHIDDAKIFCCPNSIINTKGQGSNHFLLQHPESMMLSPYTIVNYLLGENFASKAKAQVKSYSGNEQQIIDLILKDYCTYEELRLNFKGDTEVLNETLMLMEIGGIINKMAGNRYEVV